MTLSLAWTGMAGVAWAQQLAESAPAHERAPVVVEPSAPAIGRLPQVMVSEKLGQYRQFDRVEITGSSIVRKEQDTSLPVELITRDDIKRMGAIGTADVIQRLPLMWNFSEPSQVTVTGGGYSGAAIHGMRTGTLVLLNGKRLAPFGIQPVAGTERTNADLNGIPLAAIERIEVLSDGASSLYGTDAIAGVVNIITRQDRAGFELSAGRDRSHGGVDHGQASLSWGKGNLRRDGYTLQLVAEVARRDALSGADRPYMSQGQQTFSHNGQSYVAQAGNLNTSIGSATSPGTLKMKAANASEKDRYWNSLYQDGQCPQGWYPVTGQPACAFNIYPSYDIYPRQNSKRLHAMGEWTVAPMHTMYSELLYAEHTETLRAVNWPSAERSIGLTPGSAGYAETLAAGFDPARTSILWRPVDMPLLQRGFDQTNWRLAWGLKGVLDSWDYHFSAHHSRSQVQGGNEVAPLPSNVGKDAAGFFNEPAWLQAIAQDGELAQYLQSKVEFRWPRRGQTKLTSTELRASSTVFEIDGREAKIGAGAEWRLEQMSYELLNRSATDETQPDAKGGRHTLAAYSELNVPLRDTVDVTAALRHDQYSDVGGTTNGKLSGRWKAASFLAFRGSVGTGFRAPALGQMQGANKPYFYGTSSVTNDCNATLQAIAAELAGTADACQVGTLRTYSASSSELKPEKSDQMSLGFRLTPTGNFTIAADYWRVQMKDTLRTVSDVAVMNDPQANRRFFMLTPAGKLALYTPVVNLGSSLKDGIDFDVRWRKPTDWGRLTMGLQGTRMLNSSASMGGVTNSDLGAYSLASDSITPRLRARYWVGLSQPNWHVMLTLNHTAAYTDAPVTATNVQTGAKEIVTGRRVPAFQTLDLTGGVNVNRHFELRLGLYNLTNEQAPLSFAQSTPFIWGANTSMASAWGRVLSLHGVLRF